MYMQYNSYIAYYVVDLLDTLLGVDTLLGTHGILSDCLLVDYNMYMKRK